MALDEGSEKAYEESESVFGEETCEVVRRERIENFRL